jgi:aminopeptidase N
MRTDAPPLIKLADYRPPDFLIATVDLDISLDLTATRVRSCLAVRRNPAGRAGASLVLDGDELCHGAKADD